MGLFKLYVNDLQSPRSVKILDIFKSQGLQPTESTGNTPNPGSSSLPFLTWVAYVRTNSLDIDEIERRTCPLRGCEQIFETPRVMPLHVCRRPQLSKGTYKCFECGKFEKVSKCHVEGCSGQFYSVKPPLGMAKRLLSPRQPKDRHPIRGYEVPAQSPGFDSHPPCNGVQAQVAILDPNAGHDISSHNFESIAEEMAESDTSENKPPSQWSQ
jgi:hypothetical protein